MAEVKLVRLHAKKFSGVARQCLKWNPQDIRSWGRVLGKKRRDVKIVKALYFYRLIELDGGCLWPESIPNTPS